MEVLDDRAERIRLIRDSAGAIVPAGDLKRVRALRFREPGFDRAVWRQMCELGWLGLRVPEDAGGSGLGMREYCALAEECGAGLVPEPLIPCSLAARVLAGPELDRLLAGDTIVIPAWQEQPNSLALDGGTALRDGRVSGHKRFVPMAAWRWSRAMRPASRSRSTGPRTAGTTARSRSSARRRSRSPATSPRRSRRRRSPPPPISSA